MPVTNYRDLVAWQQAMNLVESVYRTTAKFPKEELFCLTSQLRRAAISVVSNIAEGQGRRTTRDFLHFLSLSSGSLKEVETQVLIAERLGYVNQSASEELMALTARIGRLLSGLTKSLKRKIA